MHLTSGTVSGASESLPCLPFLTLLSPDCGFFQEFSLQSVDSLVDDRVNILGFSIFNQSHTFFREFAQSLNQSWQENCDHAPFRGPAVSATRALPMLGPPSVGSQDTSLLGPAFSRPSWEGVPGNSASMLCMSPARWGEMWGQSAGASWATLLTALLLRTARV